MDTGATMQKLLNTLTKFKPASIKVARYGFVHIIVIVIMFFTSVDGRGNMASAMWLELWN